MSKTVALVCSLLVACATARPPQLVPASALPSETAPAPQLELAPPSAVAPIPAPRPRKYYAAPMVILDLLLFATVAPVVESIESRDGPGDDDAVTGTIAAYYGAYLFGGPLIHHLYGNKRQPGHSFLRRLGYPVLFGLGGGLVGRVLEGDCSGQELCGIGTVVGAFLGAGLGAVVAVIHDWTKAYLD